MTLKVNKTALTIMGVPFDNKKDFRGVWHALSTNMFEGWEPTEADVLHLKEKAETLREKQDVTKTV
ncbi:MAG: hypothetical protein LBS98_07775 [Coriobacteriales bacterium]|jgi:hypothetical protein|nr:hypothetical protein [Coriobacteriales bacterium]